MKILHVSTFDTGGAARAAVRLHQGLLQLGVDSNLLLLQQTDRTIPHSHQFSIRDKRVSVKLKTKIKRILKEFHLNIGDSKSRLLQNRPAGFEAFSFPDTAFDITQHRLYKEADIINLHWVAGFLDYSSFFKNNQKRIVWTLHDMNPFTGGCHYSNNYGGFMNDCSNCPQLHPRDSDIARTILNTKISAIGEYKNLTIVSPSDWLLQKSQKSTLFKRLQHYKIPYGLNKDIYKPLNQQFSRELLRLPSDKKVILFVADSLNNPRKGYERLLAAVQLLENQQDIVLCSIGDRGSAATAQVNLFELGVINNEELMCAAYSAADIFAIPSSEDNLPNTVLESLMCGTPVAGFAIGGLVDIIEDGRNGHLSLEVSPAGLAAALQKLVASPLADKRAQIRTDAIKRFDLLVQANAYKTLYENH